MYGSCALCGQEILDGDEHGGPHDIHDQATGWHPRRRRKGGGHHDKGKFWHSTGAVAHGSCVEKYHRRKKAGLPTDQDGLF
jgi:hypothetical protein